MCVEREVPSASQSRFPRVTLKEGWYDWMCDCIGGTQEGYRRFTAAAMERGLGEFLALKVDMIWNFQKTWFGIAQVDSSRTA